MPGQIQLSPPGLLGLLQIKNFGQSPGQLSETYVATFPMVPWALLANAETLQVGFAAGSIGGNLNAANFRNDAVSSVPGTFNVPNGQWWYVHRFTLGFSPTGATGWSWPSIGYLVDAAATAKYLVVRDFPAASVLAPDPTSPFQITAEDFFVPPGSQLGFAINVANAAATNVASLAALITRLPV